MTHKLPGGHGARVVFDPVLRPQGGDARLRDPYLVLMAALVAEARANGDPPATAAERASAGRKGAGERLLGLLAVAAGRRTPSLAALLSAPLGETPPATYMGITEAGDPTPGATRATDETQHSRAA